jgi:hypothetical protein
MKLHSFMLLSATSLLLGVSAPFGVALAQGMPSPGTATEAPAPREIGPIPSFKYIYDLGPCPIDGIVTLQIPTSVGTGWTVNGVPAVAVSNGGWATPVAGSVWIGPTGGGTGSSAGTLTYAMTFAAPYWRSAMSLSGNWYADNCGLQMQAGNGPVVNSGAGFGTSCVSSIDFHAPPSPIGAGFGAGDLTAPIVTITFKVSNQAGTPTGFDGVFTVRATCDCSRQLPVIQK